jgi:hypothetical protein
VTSVATTLGSSPRYLLTLLAMSGLPAQADVTFHVKEYPVNVAVEIHVNGEIRESDARDLLTGFEAARQLAAAQSKNAATPRFVLKAGPGAHSAQRPLASRTG